MEKLQVYYQTYKNNVFHESLTISFYDFDEQTNTYKQKIILEKNGEKYKIKRLNTLDDIKEFINNLDLTKFNCEKVNTDESYFYIKHGNQTLMANNAEDIRELLDWMQFDEIAKYDLDMYTKCD